MFKKWKDESGFSLVYFMIVIAILGIISASAIPEIFDYLNNRNNGDPLVIDSIKTIEIQRLIKIGSHPSIIISCKNVSLDIDNRRIIIEGLKSINGTLGSEYSWVVEMKIVNLMELLYIYLDKNAPYNIVITEKNKEPQKFFVDKDTNINKEGGR